MNKILILIMLFALPLCMQGQAINQSFASDTTKGAQTKYMTGAKESLLYQGYLTFQFTTAHDAVTATLQGRNGGNVWFDIDTITVSGATAVNRKFTQHPPEYVYYRVKFVGNPGDTCYISNGRLTLKY